MTTDNKTPDPTPALLSAARLADYRALLAKAPTVALTSSHGSIFPADEAEQQARIDRRLDPTILQAYGTTEEMYPWAEFFAAAPDMVRALLAHLDALTPRAVVDGEALGRGLYMEIHGATPGHDYMLALWSEWNHSIREAYKRGALALHAIGYAAGAVAMTGEGDDPGTEGAVLILMKRHDAELYAAHAAGRSEGEAERAEAAKLALFVNTALADECAALRAIAADPNAHAAEAVAREKALHDLEVEGLDATIARLTAELAEARATIASAADKSIDDIETARRFGYHEHDGEVTAARLDGAREEREACALIAEEEERLLYRQDGEQACARVRRRIRARATEGRQGS